MKCFKTNLKKLYKFCWTYKGSLFQLFIVAAAVIIQFVPSDALAWSNPSSGTFGYEIYDYFINKLVKGGIGYAAGGACMLGALFAAYKSAWAPASILAISSGVLFNLDSVARSIGFCV